MNENSASPEGHGNSEARAKAAERRPAYLCDRCGFEMIERQCKVICPNCGSRWDCSDLSIYVDEAGSQPDRR